jgi:hypothetical protein
VAVILDLRLIQKVTTIGQHNEDYEEKLQTSKQLVFVS